VATVVDALIITLGLDTKGFKQGQDQAKKSLKNLSDDSGKAAKDMEARGKQAAKFFGAIKVEALSLLAIFTAGMGLKGFISDTVSSSAQVQNLAGNLQQSASEVKAWEKTFERAGASASDATSLFTSAASDIGRLQTGQGMSEALKGLAMSGGNINEALKGPREMVLEESRVLEKLNAINPQLARARAQQMGLNDAQFAVLKGGPAALQQQVALQQRMIGLNDGQIAGLAKLNAKWADFKTRIEGMLNTMLTRIPGVDQAIDVLSQKFEQISNWVMQHGDAVMGFFVALAAAIAIPMAPTLALTAAVAAVAAGVGYLYEQWLIWTNGGKTSLAGFFEFFKDVWNAIKVLFTGTTDDIHKAWRTLFDDIKGMWNEIVSLFNGDKVKDAVGSAMDWAEDRIKSIWGSITGAQDESKGSGPAIKKSPDFDAASLLKKTENNLSGAANNLANTAFGALISRGEGDYDSVNRGAKGGYKAGKENLEGMTVSEVMAAQKEGKFNAAGRYQIIKGTLADAAKSMGLSGNEKFDKGMQDKIFEQYLVNNKRKAIGDYLSGKSEDIAAAVYATSQEWASVAVPKGMRTESGKISTGVETYYDRSGKNKASITASEAMAKLQNTRGNMMPVGARALGANNSPPPASNSSEVNIQQINIQTQATDAKGIARDAQAAFAKHPMIVPQANTGLS
jgi:hypothetical protein